MKEVFKEHKSGYLISNLGRIKGVRVSYLTPSLSKSGYLVTALPVDGVSSWYSVHRAVYETFKGDIPLGLVINHIDGCKTNNNVDNLECVTYQCNTLHSISLGLQVGQKGEENSRAKLSNLDFEHICTLLTEGLTNKEISKLYHIHERYVSLIRHKRRWKDSFPDWYIPVKSLGNSGLPLKTMKLVYKDCLGNSSNKDISKKWNLDPSTISRIRSKDTWKDFITYFELDLQRPSSEEE